MKGVLIFCQFVTILLLCGCNFNSRNKYQRYGDFLESHKALLSEEIKSDSVYLRYPYRVEIKGNLAVILDLHPESHFLHAFTFPEWKHITSFGKRGEGPEDILSAERVRICSPDSVWVLDSNRRQITRWNVSGGSAERMEEIALDEQLIRTLDFCKTETGFIVPDYSGNYRYHVLDAQGRITGSFGSVPTEKNMADSERMALAQAWRSFMDYNPKNGILAMVTQLGEVIEIFNLKTGGHSVCYGPNGEPVFKIAQNEAIPNGIKGYHDVVVSDSCIYAVFNGVRFKEYINAACSGKELPDGGKNIYVFDFNGKQNDNIELFYSAFGLEVSKRGFFITSTDTDIPIHVFDY